MARNPSSGRRVREPVQVYLDGVDRGLLEDVVKRTGLSRAEILRRGLRRLANSVMSERRPGWSLELFIGCMGPGQPSDLSERHDDYLYGEDWED